MTPKATYTPQLCLPAPKKSRAWLPAVLLALMFAVGTLLYLLIPMNPSVEAEPQALELNPAAGMLQQDCFSVRDGVLYFDESKFIANPILVIPSAIQGEAVTAIGPGCFENVEGVTTMILPSSVTRIETNAFAGCADLRGLELSEGVTFIGEDAFRDCMSLEALYIPTAVSSIGKGAFHNCPRLLYIFYSGFYSEWEGMYTEYITPFTWIITLDGEYPHGVK